MEIAKPLMSFLFALGILALPTCLPNVVKVGSAFAAPPKFVKAKRPKSKPGSKARKPSKAQGKSPKPSTALNMQKSFSKAIKPQSLVGHQVLSRGPKAFQSVGSKVERRRVRNAFAAGATLIKLNKPIVVHRHHQDGGGSNPSRWFSRQIYKSTKGAEKFLALPRGNDATNRSAYLIPAGSVIIVGRAASQASNTRVFGPNATGGGEQIYIVRGRRPIRIGTAN